MAVQQILSLTSETPFTGRAQALGSCMPQLLLQSLILQALWSWAELLTSLNLIPKTGLYSLLDELAVKGQQVNTWKTMGFSFCCVTQCLCSRLSSHPLSAPSNRHISNLPCGFSHPLYFASSSLPSSQSPLTLITYCFGISLVFSFSSAHLHVCFVSITNPWVLWRKWLCICIFLKNCSIIYIQWSGQVLSISFEKFWQSYLITSFQIVSSLSRQLLFCITMS